MNVVGGPAAYEDIVLFGSTNSQFYAASYDGRMVGAPRVRASSPMR